MFMQKIVIIIQLYIPMVTNPPILKAKIRLHKISSAVKTKAIVRSVGILM